MITFDTEEDARAFAAQALRGDRDVEPRTSGYITISDDAVEKARQRKKSLTVRYKRL